MAMTRWLAESIRISFLGSVLTPGKPLFEDVVGYPPTEQISRPQQNFLQENGLYDGQHHLVIAQQVGRLDVFMSDDPTANTVDPSQTNYKPFFEIGAYKDALPIAEKLATTLIKGGLVQYQKIAFAPTLILGAPRVQAANRAFKEYVKFAAINEDLDNSIFWQVNRPRMSQLGLGQVNRFSKWQVFVSQLVTFGSILPVAAPATKAGLRLEMDVNGPANASLEGRSQNDLANFLLELSGLATEISEEGDIP